MCRCDIQAEGLEASKPPRANNYYTSVCYYKSRYSGVLVLREDSLQLFEPR